MQIAAIAPVLPDNYYDQESLIAAIRHLWAGRHHNVDRLIAIYRNACVKGRHLALSLEEYEHIETFTDANNAFIKCAVDLGERAIREAVKKAGLSLVDINHLFFVSITGIAAPSVDALLVNRLNLRNDIKRTPIFGLGCMAGAAGITKAFDYVKAYPDQVAVVLSVELCSLTLQRNDLSVANIVSSGLFGDAAAALVVTGGERKKAAPVIVDTRSVFYNDTEHIMGWDITSDGFKIVLSGQTPKIVEAFIRPDIEKFLADNGLSIKDIGKWAIHPGGPKILEAVEKSLELSREELALSWKNLHEAGNVSSASILMILQDIMDNHCPPDGTYGLYNAMGPGFCSEMGLLRW
ncbi:MAG: type III polyketide synthase [Deltaproteobacteria bacterium]|nr:type III polyketide synthase [Deltaproteobacteria bacterium]